MTARGKQPGTADSHLTTGQVGGALNQNNQSPENQNDLSPDGASQKGDVGHQGDIGGGRASAERRRRGSAEPGGDSRVRGERQ